MTQLNMHMTPEFERALSRLMRARGIKSKSEAIRLAVQECLEKSDARAKTVDFREWIGLANQYPVNPKPRFKSDDDLWERS